MADHNELGKQGEEISVQYLMNHGYLILERNWRFSKAEVDIIATKGDVLIIVEVKTRSNIYFGNPEDFISSKKKKLLISAANEFITTRDLDFEVRFDILAVEISQNDTKIKHIEGAYCPHELI